MVGVLGDGEESRSDGMASVVAGGVHVERGIRVSNIVVNFYVMIDMSLAQTVDGDGLLQSSSRSRQPGSNIAFAAKPANGEARQFQRRIAMDVPILAVQQFGFGIQIVHQSKSGTNVGPDLTRDVKTRPL